ncbi:ATP-dependent zinc metalloprotease FtsH [bacterium]|nr:ATP-dependent zinc metalloprotease FtsH [bacterium]
MKKLLKNFIIFFIIFLLIASIFSFFGLGSEKPETKGLNYLITAINNNEVNKIEVDESKIFVFNNNGEEVIIKKEANQSLSELLSDLGVEKNKLENIEIIVKEQSSLDFWLINILPFLIPFLLIAGFVYFMMRGVQGSNSRAMTFGQANIKQVDKIKNKTTFKDVAGAKEAKEELNEVVEFLKTPKKFRDLGAKIPKGVLLLGSPGTGKTLLARSVAGEAKVPFFHISGSEFVEMFVGVGASRVRSLFQKAKKTAPCIIFIDEIDAVGRKRGAGLGGSHDEREQTLNQILVEMDGFDKNDNVIIIAATNRPDVLDPALLRPGRFDRQIVIDKPDINDRESILKVHSKEKPLSKNVNLRRIAERTSGFSGADLANLLNEGAILTARRDKKEIGNEELFEAIEKVMIGPERKSRVISDKEKEITAFHEAGHAIVAHFLPDMDPVQKISIIARGRAGGYTLKVPVEDRHMYPRSEFISEISVLLGGYLTEKHIYKEVTTGATSDLRRATDIAKRLITDYGMSESLGLRTFGEKEDMIFLGREIHEQKDYSEKMAEKIDEEIYNIIEKAKFQAEEIIKEKEDLLRKVSKALMEKETLEKEEFEEIVGKKEVKKN